ncbi:hypothetical protein AVEN_15698-1 [Araneus ventricosus]|uniref:Uncharacterized protein n=1 Tax=Araneus ventricosus TaxID=182803 RepID=A0A4Y2JQV5_ARAVE|nr:hypothetical protein AVEN_15698-1 [Araneus ventricosus]
MYVLDNKCEYDACENLDNKIVPFIKITQYPFVFSTSYGKCNLGKLTNIQKCPEKWDYFDTYIDVTQLPKVFDGNSCETPKLCQNVELVDQDVIIPSYEYRKYLSTWEKSDLYDRIKGYKCDSNQQLQEVPIENGSFIKDFKIVNACDQGFMKFPTKNANVYFDCNTKTSETCLPDMFFNGSECVNRIQNAFQFKGLDIFKFKELKANNWIEHRSSINLLNDKPQCNSDEEYLPVLNICTHRDCKVFSSIIRELKKPIKLDDTFQCVWEDPRIKKIEYEKPFNNVYLNFWTQSFTTSNSKQINCTEGHRVQTGNFILDSTLYTTCKYHQPFVFCPSSSTKKIEKVHTNTFACSPKPEVFSYKLPANQSIEIFTNEIANIIVPKDATYTINQNPPIIVKDEKIITINEIKQLKKNNFSFQANEVVTIEYNILSNNPPNTFFKNKVLKRVTNPYSILHDNGTIESDQLKFHDYTTINNL